MESKSKEENVTEVRFGQFAGGGEEHILSDSILEKENEWDSKDSDLEAGVGSSVVDFEEERRRFMLFTHNNPSCPQWHAAKKNLIKRI